MTETNVRITGEQLYEVVYAAEKANVGANVLDPYEILAAWFNNIMKGERND